MLNDFRTKLLNVTDTYDVNDDGAVYHHIANGFTSIKLPPELLSFYELLYPTTDDNFKYFLTHGYIEVVEAAGLHNYIIKDDSRLTYDLTNESEFFRTNYTLDAIALYNHLQFNDQIVNRMLAAPKKDIADHTPENLWVQHPNPVYKLAGVLVAYVDRVGKVLQ